MLSEIRDPVARARVQTTVLPFLTIRSPKPESVKAVSEFAKKTGDLGVLSGPDVKVLALAYEVECERNGGDWRLRKDPNQGRVNGAPPGREALEEKREVVDKPKEEGKEVFVDAKAPVKSVWGTPVPKPLVKEEEVVDPKATEIPNWASAETKTKQAAEEDTKEPSAAEIQQALDNLTLQPAPAPIPETVQVDEELESDSEDDDDEGWITPSNIKKVQEKEAAQDAVAGKTTKPPTVMQAACITSDYAMQNVLLRMNLNLLSTSSSLAPIRHLKTWVLRCHACFYISKATDLSFCPRCGKPTLLRTSCSTDKDGNFKVHLKKNFQFNKRGDRYAIPRNVGGSSNMRVKGGGKGGWGNELVLVEDQKEFVRAQQEMGRRKERDLMDEDYLPDLLSGNRKGGHGKPRVGAGRNVNSKKRR